MRLKFALWLASVFAALVALAVTVASLVYAGLAAGDQEVLRRVLEERGPLLGFLALIVLIACGGMLRWLFGRFVAPLRALAEQAVIVASANREHRVAAEGGPEAADLARAINRLGDAYRAQHSDMDARVAESNARLEEERNRLAALMSELSEGVLVCNAAGPHPALQRAGARAVRAGGRRPARGAEPRGPGPLGLRAPRPRPGRARAGQDPATASTAKRRAPGHAVLHHRASQRRAASGCSFAPFLPADGGIAGMVLTLEDVTRTCRPGSAAPLAAAGARHARARSPRRTCARPPRTSSRSRTWTTRDRARFAEIVAAESRALSEHHRRGAARVRRRAEGRSSTLEDMRARRPAGGRAAAHRHASRARRASRPTSTSRSGSRSTASRSRRRSRPSPARLRDDYGVRESAVPRARRSGALRRARPGLDRRDRAPATRSRCWETAARCRSAPSRRRSRCRTCSSATAARSGARPTGRGRRRGSASCCRSASPRRPRQRRAQRRSTAAPSTTISTSSASPTPPGALPSAAPRGL